MTKIINLSTAQLLAVYNHYADKAVTRFATPAIGRTRVAKLLAGIDAPECQAIGKVLGGEVGRCESCGFETDRLTGLDGRKLCLSCDAAEADLIDAEPDVLDAPISTNRPEAAPVKAAREASKKAFVEGVGAVLAGADVETVARSILPSDHGDEAAPTRLEATMARTRKATAKVNARLEAESKAANGKGKKAAKAKAPAKAEKAAPVAKAETSDGAKAPTGSKATILAMIARKGGCSEKEVCEALGWVAAGATIGRAIKLASFTVVKVKGEDGRVRYCKA